MFTRFDKALVALIMAAVYMANTFLNAGITLDPAKVEAVIVALTPIMVWLVPNRAKA